MRACAGLARGRDVRVCRGSPFARSAARVAALPRRRPVLGSGVAARRPCPGRPWRRGGFKWRQEGNAFVAGGGFRPIRRLDQALVQVTGDEALFRHAELLNRGFDLGHRAHASITTSRPPAGKSGGRRAGTMRRETSRQKRPARGYVGAFRGLSRGERAPRFRYLRKTLRRAAERGACVVPAAAPRPPPKRAGRLASLLRRSSARALPLGGSVVFSAVTMPSSPGQTRGCVAGAAGQAGQDSRGRSTRSVRRSKHGAWQKRSGWRAPCRRVREDCLGNGAVAAAGVHHP